MVDTGARGREPPVGPREILQRLRSQLDDVEVARKHDDVLGPGERHGEPCSTDQLRLRKSLVGPVARAMQVRNHERVPVLVGNTDCLDDTPLLGPREPGDEVEAKRSCLSAAEASAVQRQDSMVEHAQPRRELNRVSLTCEQRAEQTVIEIGQPPPERRRDGHRPERRTRSNVADGEAAHGPRGHLLQAENVRTVGGRKADHLVEVGAPLRRHGVPVEQVPAPNEHTSTLLRRARAPRRPAGVHSLVRPRARCRPRSARRGRDPCDLAVPVRGRPGRGGLSPRGALLPAVVENLQALASSPAAQGGGTHCGRRVAGARPRRRRARAVACAAAGRRPPEVSRTICLHRPRPPAAAHIGQARPVAPDARPVRRGRRSHGARTPDARRSRRRQRM